MTGYLRQVDGGAHAERHCFAMQESRVCGLGFERVAERVSEIQDAAEVAFPLIGGHDLGFDAHRIGDDTLEGLRPVV